MASMACYQDHHHHHHMAIDPLPVAYSSTSLTPPDVSSIRCIFQGVARVNKQAAATTRSNRNTMEQALHSTMALPEEPDSMENSESSISSCFLSSNSDDDDVSSSSTSSTLSAPDAAASPQHEGPLVNLTSLCAALPVKRGLSRYFSGKSQSFSSLAHVSSVADLAKPENPYVKRRRTTAGDSLLKHQSYPPRCASIAGNSKRHANNHYKGLRSFPVCEDADLEGHAKPKPYPIKCFSLPELQKTE